MRCVLSNLTNRPLRKHPAHLCLEVAPLLGAVEVFEHGKAALQQVGAKRFRFRVREIPEARLPHEGDRVVEQFWIVERENKAAVDANVETRELVEDEREVSLCSRVVVIPRRVEAAATKAKLGAPPQSHEREPSVVCEVRPIRLTERGQLHRRSHCEAQDDDKADAQPSTHASLSPNGERECTLGCHVGAGKSTLIRMRGYYLSRGRLFGLVGLARRAKTN